MISALARCAAAGVLAAGFLAAQPLVSGPPVPSLKVFDTVMTSLMATWSIPGAALAITKDGRLVFAHGYGFADVEDSQPAQPDSLFRIASISKPFTAAAALKLIEQGKLHLSDKAFTILSDLTPPSGATVDQRIYKITIQNLLEHKGGWDRSIGGDPPFAFPVTAAQTFNATPPATPDLLIRYMMGQPLQYNPGSVYSYSNFGYIVLGAVIERVSGQSYTDYLQSAVMQPAGILRMYPGASLLSGRLADEVKYYDYPGAPLSVSIFPPVGAPVPLVYGGFPVELMLANGGWVADTMDLLRYADNINGQLDPAILRSPPSGFVAYVPPVGVGWGWIAEGSLPGTSTILHLDTGYQIGSRVTYAVLFNTRQGGNPSPDILADADARLLQAANSIANWPSGDLFPTYSGAASSCSFTLDAPGVAALPGGDSGSVGIMATNYCAWTTTSDSSWLTFPAGSSGTANGAVFWMAAPNTGAAARSGTLSIGGQPFIVTQAGALHSACDIDGDGSLKVADVRALVSEALGIAAAVHDLNHDHDVDVLDLQALLNTLLGAACPA